MNNKTSKGSNNRTGSAPPHKRSALTTEERRRIAKRRKARRRKVYFFRTVFAFLLVLIIYGIFKVVSGIFISDTIQASTKNVEEEIIDENNKETIDTSDYDFVVCIDPGHGYDDEGCRSNIYDSLVERDLVFDIATKVKAIIEDSDTNIGILFTHSSNKVPSSYKGDQYLFGVEDRVKYANTLDIDFYVSIHCDYYEEDSSINGSRVYYLQSDNSMQNIAQYFSDSIEANMEGKTPLLMPMTDSDSYYVLRYTNVPAVLIETGFVTNKAEAKAMLTDKWRENMAKGIAEGILDAYHNGDFD